MKKNQKKTVRTKTASRKLPVRQVPISMGSIEVVENVGNADAPRIDTTFGMPEEIGDMIDDASDGGEYSPSYVRLLCLLERRYREVLEIRGEGMIRITLSFPN